MSETVIKTLNMKYNTWYMKLLMHKKDTELCRVGVIGLVDNQSTFDSLG